MSIKTVLTILTVLVFGMVFAGGCGKGEQTAVVKSGDKIKVEYTGTLADGSQFDSNVGKQPLEFEVGAGQMIAGFDKAMLGMKVGESKSVIIPAAEAYGQRQENMIIEVTRETLGGLTPKVGDQLMMTSGGQQFTVTVIEISAASVTVDANHQLAGKDLTFKIKLLAIVK
jgi:peptidylprolyl isomerase